jgi:peptidoglycan/xylan/chitin deacetylase (PgdA/CDA1 family)
MYHAFGERPPDQDPHCLFVPEPELDRQLGFLARYFRPLTLDQYLDGLGNQRFPSRSVLVTIDDGYRSTLETAAPILAHHGIPAALFICPGILGSTTSWMPEMPPADLLSADEVRSVRSFGIEIGVHGMDHSLLPRVAPEELRRQVGGARQAVADIVGHPPRAFAYPEGRFDQAAVTAVREAGYDAAFSVLEGGADRFTITRVPVTSRDAFATFAVKTLPGFSTVFRATRNSPRIRRVAAWAARQKDASLRKVR